VRAGIFILLVLIAIGPLYAQVSAQPSGLGPRERFSGVYFTNFENSRFTACAGEACRHWTDLNGMTVTCAPAACKDLEHRIVMLNGSHDRWGEFAITFVGRRTVQRHQPRFLGDGDHDVRIESIVRLTLIEGRQ